MWASHDGLRRVGARHGAQRTKRCLVVARMSCGANADLKVRDCPPQQVLDLFQESK
jgi:hypothetical protein